MSSEKDLTIIVSLYNSDNFINQFIDKIKKVDLNKCILKIYFFINSHKDKNLISQKLDLLNKEFFEIIKIEEDLDLYDTWNLGIKEATTQYVANLSIDDYVEPTYYSQCINCLNNNDNISLVSSNFISYNRNNFQKPNRYFNTDEPFTTYTINNLIHYDKRINQFVKKNYPNCCPVWRKKLHTKYGFFDSKNFDFVGDFEFWARCLSNGETFANINQFLIYYYHDNNTASTRVWFNENKEFIEKSTDFPYKGYHKSMFGENHDRIHYVLNKKVVDIYKPRVAILIYNYNQEDDLIICLKSILEQEFKNFNIIICDDNSEDNSIQKIEELNSDKITIFKNNIKLGKIISKNKLIEYCDCENFLFLDADDILHKGTLNKIMTENQKDNELMFGNIISYNDNFKKNICFQNQYIINSFNKEWPEPKTVLYKKGKSISIPTFKVEKNNLEKVKVGYDWEWLYHYLKLNNFSLKNIGLPLINCKALSLNINYKNELAILDTISRLYNNNLIKLISNKIIEFYLVCILKNKNITELLEKYDSSLKDKIQNTKLIDTHPTFWKNLMKKYLPNNKKFNFDRKIFASFLYFKINDYPHKQDVFYKLFFENFKKMRQINRFKEIHVLGNGPSLKEYNFNLLKNRNILTIGMNLAYRYWKTINLYPRVYCCLDTVVLEHNCQDIYNLIKEGKIELFYLRDLIYEKYPDLKTNPKVITYEEIGNKLLGLLNRPFLTTGSGAMKLGISLYPKKLYIFGIDCNYVEVINEAKVEVKDGKEILVINEDIKTNPNYFFDEYQQKGDKYNIPDPQLELNIQRYGNHLHMVAFCQISNNLKKYKQDIEVYNASEVSKIPYFEIVKYF